MGLAQATGTQREGGEVARQSEDDKSRDTTCPKKKKRVAHFAGGEIMKNAVRLAAGNTPKAVSSDRYNNCLLCCEFASTRRSLSWNAISASNDFSMRQCDNVLLPAKLS